MKYIITESKLNSAIYEYLSENYYPDYNWDTPEEYEKYLNRWGTYVFEVDDVKSYLYVKHVKEDDILNKPNSLIVYSHMSDDLTNWFGDFWKPVFVKWFEDNTRLKVDHLVI